MLLQVIGERTADERLEGHRPASVAACLTPIGREPGQPATCEGRPTGGVAWRKAGQLGRQLRGRTSGAYEVDTTLDGVTYFVTALRLQGPTPFIEAC